jgi:hypothetical protein
MNNAGKANVSRQVCHRLSVNTCKCTVYCPRLTWLSPLGMPILWGLLVLNVKIIVHVQLIRVISIYYSYFLHIIFWENPMYKSPGEYCLNVSKQLEYKSSDVFFLNIFYIGFSQKIMCKKYE